MNYHYISKLNIKNKNRRMKNFFNFLPKRTPKVIQIGVGGATSSAKTVLIDAILSVLDSNGYPGYLGDDFRQKRNLYAVTNSFEHSSFQNASELRAHVSNYFDVGKATPVNTGTWSFETYIMEFEYNGSKRIILLRNMSGEVFQNYFHDQINNQTFNSLFQLFIRGNDEFKHKYKKLFNYKAFGINSENEAEKLKTMFFNHISDYISKHKVTSFIPADIIKYENSFYDYLFYITSQITIKCIRSVIDGDEEEIKNEKDLNSRMVKAGRREKFLKNEADYVCYTQIDRYIDKYMTDNKNQLVKFKNDSNNIFFDQYITIMNKIHRHFYTLRTTVAEAGENRDDTFGSIKDTKFFPVTIAFNFSRNQFYNFKNQKSDEEGGNVYWGTDANNDERTSLGVVELVYCILKKGTGIEIKEFKTNKTGSTYYLNKLDIAKLNQ